MQERKGKYPMDIIQGMKKKIRNVQSLLPRHEEKESRAVGTLCPIFSLPSEYGIGDLGEEAYAFIDFLAETGQTYWQILPFGPLNYGNSPYSPSSAFAGNPMLIDIRPLEAEKLVSRFDLVYFHPELHQIRYSEAWEFKHAVLKKAFGKFRGNIPYRFRRFCKKEAYWLDDYALYEAMKKHNSEFWGNWDKPIRYRQEKALAAYTASYGEDILFVKFCQYLFHRQWERLHRYARQKGIKIVGDMPFYISCQSADVWTNTQFFAVDRDGKMISAGGMPPDPTFPCGQDWGMPTYCWNDELISWQMKRYKKLMNMVDVIRVDHGCGFFKYWANMEQSTERGTWEMGPGYDFFAKIKEECGKNVQLWIENVGNIEQKGWTLPYPNTDILFWHYISGGQFSHIESSSVLYTSNHDTETLAGWLGDIHDDRKPTPKECIQYALGQDVKAVIVPVQDWLCLGDEARMNVPGTIGRNWKWKLTHADVVSHRLTREAAKLSME